VTHGFAFLVARGRHTGFRTLLAPGFLVDAGVHNVLADSTGTSAADCNDARITEVHNAVVGLFSVGYTSEPIERDDIESAGVDRRELLEDEHGRALEMVYGVVCRDELSAPLNAEDLQTARAHAFQRYRSFLADETKQHVEPSMPFVLRGNTRPRGDSVSRRAVGGDLFSKAGASSAHGRRFPNACRIAAIAVVLTLAAIAMLIFLTGRKSPTVTVYSSLPMHGPNGPRSAEIVRGMKLALLQAGGKAGKFRVKYESMDDSRGVGGWTKQAVVDNARKAARDKHTSVYLGDLDSAASIVSIPILSDARIAQISPTNTAVGLTTSEPGAKTGEPDNHYVDGFRNYARIVPRDTYQARALATVSRKDGCSRVAIVRSPDAGLGDSLARAMNTHGRHPVLDEVVTSRNKDSSLALAQHAANRRANCVILTADTNSGTVETFKDMARALGSKIHLYAWDRLAIPAFTDPTQGGLPERIAARVQLTLPIPAPSALTVKGLSFGVTQRRNNRSQRSSDPYEILGYEAMSLALDAIERSRTASRKDIVNALFDTQHRHSVLGTYSIDPTGDTTLTDYGVFTIRHGALNFERRIEASG
jgi:branched-chain amino acid transport system substrate-binding protein